MQADIRGNLARIQERIAAAAERAGRVSAEVALIAVSKAVRSDRIREAVDAGIRTFGENYLQEAQDKIPLFGPDVRWHFIGHLQSNKAKYVAGRFALIQSIDSERLAQELGRRAAQSGIVQPVLVEVKLDPAESKFGTRPEGALDLAEQVDRIPGLRLDGLMGIPPAGAEGEDVRPYFRQLRKLFQELPPANRRTLSMGMSADFEAAIEEGSTMVRIGTAIFGRRA